jgi:hypothetical protein
MDDSPLKRKKKARVSGFSAVGQRNDLGFQDIRTAATCHFVRKSAHSPKRRKQRLPFSFLAEIRPFTLPRQRNPGALKGRHPLRGASPTLFNAVREIQRRTGADTMKNLG